MRLARLAPSDTSAAARVVRRWAAAPTGRAAALFGLGLVWLAPAWLDRRALILMLAWNLVVAAAILVDGWRLPGAGALSVTRHWGGALTIGHPVTVTIRVQNGGHVAVFVRATDYVSPALALALPVAWMAAPAGRAGTAQYEITPRERGDATVGEMVVEWRSGWGLVERWAQAPIGQTVRVYPDLEEARRHSMYLIRTQQITLEKRRARRLAAGREFDRLREYRAGDERRDISWRASARRGRLVTRIYQPERSQTVWLLVDAGRLLRARTGGQTLLDRVATAALAVAQVAMTSGDNVGLVAYGRRTQHRLPPRRGAAHLRSLTEALALVRAEPVEADHASAAAALRSGQHRRALVVWMTEVAETAGVPDVIEYAMHLVPRHVLLFATMRQPEIAALSASSPSTTTDMYRVIAAQEAVDRRETLLRGLRQRGALIVDTSPEALASGVVDRYLEVKERGVV